MLSEPVIAKVIGWLGFSVLIGLAPLIFVANRARRDGRPDWVTAAIGQGELLIFTIALCACAVGLLLLNPSGASPYWRLLSGVANLFIVVMASLNFADMTAAYRRPRLANTAAGRNLSFLYFTAGLIAQLSAVVTVELD